MKRLLILEDGTYFEGVGFGAPGIGTGEVVFTTGMSGYQEVLTDPSFKGQMIMFTYPTIGNYGINRDDFESMEPSCNGVIVKDYARVASNWRSKMTLDEFLKNKKIPGISGIDTRALTRKLRESGTIKGSIIDVVNDINHEYDQLKATVLPNNQVHEVSTTKAYHIPGVGKNVVVVDYGMKQSILRELVARKCGVTVVPYHYTAEQILELAPDGVMLSNGPGDPKDVLKTSSMILGIQGKVPIFGICLGHQLLSLSNGADTFKLKYGHRGSNHPVKEIASNQVYFTSQNHGYAVSRDSLDTTELMLTHIEINDGTVEGIKHKKYPSFSVQFHPDAAPGPHDAVSLFDEFVELMETWGIKNAEKK
ncbi:MULTISPECIES: carbamoyl phosphate synthase small subunit [Vagococcus]|uniref:Carbamoyl phosphate synthase small chain n=1 Tax=Vagococcus fluvialis bH819 TaxID=1255619 RepID=A0A1X6WND1_9ENTE|nr:MULTISPECIES: carbamoyl phosphate synthase small subunit [Vagococcus]SLM85833.1 Carbamoyl-phosphate synthase small chain [Vagococcus fluvialis bH819]HCM90255.1 carbamoyl phosphate synthase small subunit [Vagococcus sp.]